MSGFASLQPALTARLTFKPPVVIGNVNRGGQQFIALINEGGSLKSEPGFSPAVDAEFVFGTDHFWVSPDQSYATIDVKAAMKNADGATISYMYNGIIEINEEFGKILMGSPDAKTVDFGLVFTHTGASPLKGLENARFVGTSRFIMEEGKPQVIEMKISKIVKGQ
ncbi:uncharacterized protein A1O5_04339 [Cladophialophora psammophila CBS 110553]|uniref:Lipid/polyisoprenoid-binding YceI-like domain-containing protein n=1 Tax=Cladophialophora psammophila CBS 110553 TaxID=1182543 RepID=W9WV99_9EURO|nr:uncharacterized protein A1O5_04339 [Cladophialophora psammophila CBS 110553]EXJ71838.1 hypothetical protein A1O5_04339 [Cladophialophora psammophila CBS 110553]